MYVGRAYKRRSLAVRIEMTHSTLICDCAQVESLVQKYTDTATQMKLLPLSAKHAYGFDYEIEIDAHTGGVEAAIALTAHLKNNVRLALLNFKKNRGDRRSKALDDVLELEDQVQRCREKLSTEEQSEQNALSLARKIESNIQRNRDAVDAAIKKKAVETEEVEMEIQAIRDDKDTALQQTQALQQLEDAEKTYVAWRAFTLVGWSSDTDVHVRLCLCSGTRRCRARTRV